LSALRLLAAFALALGVAACAASDERAADPATGAPLSISNATSGELTKYLRLVKSTRPGAFAISADGRDSFFTWCDDITCATTNYSIPALAGCRSLTSGQDCVVLYVRNQPRFAFSRTVDAVTGRHGSQEQPRQDFDIGR
jgi:hypothetical protein